MESVRLLQLPALRGPNCHKAGTIQHVLQAGALLVLAAAYTLQAQTAGSIVTHTLQASGQHQFVDSSGNVYVATDAVGQAPVTPGAAQSQPGSSSCPAFDGTQPCTSAYITKADSNGNLVIATLLGGYTNTSGNAVTADSAGNIYVMGQTDGSFPVTANAAIATQPPGGQSYAAKLSADGHKFLYATYLPAQLGPIPAVLTVDAAGDLYIGGTNDSNQAIVVKVSADGSAISYTLMLASIGKVTALAVDPEGNLVAAGGVGSTDLPVTVGALQATLPTSITGGFSGFVAKLNPTGGVLAATYLGGSVGETISAVGTDSGGNIYVSGQSDSPDFPTTPNSLQATPTVPLWAGGGYLGFIVKMSPGENSLAYSTFMPGAGLGATAISSSGDAYVTGPTLSGFPVTASAPQPCMAAGGAAYVAHLNASGALVDATYVGLQNSQPTTMALASDGSLYVATLSDGVLAQVRFGGVGWSAPPCMTLDVLNAASQTSSVVPGEFVTLVGWGIGPQTGVAYQPGPQGEIPTLTGGVQVLFDGVAAPVLYAQSQQVNAQAPFSISGSTVVTLQYSGMTFGPFSKAVALADPEIFRMQPGVSTQAMALNQDNTFNGPSNPAARGSFVYFYGTGFGPTSPGCAAGGPNVPVAANLLQITVNANLLSLGTQEVLTAVEPVLYAGSAPTLPCGVVQINMLVPEQAALGLNEVFLRVANTTILNSAFSTIVVK